VYTKKLTKKGKIRQNSEKFGKTRKNPKFKTQYLHLLMHKIWVSIMNAISISRYIKNIFEVIMRVVYLHHQSWYQTIHF